MTLTATETTPDTAETEAPKHNLGGDYPTTWEAYIGQDRAKKQLMTLARAAKMLGKPMDHVLITSGTPGQGKTALSLLTAEEAGAGIKVAGGQLTAGAARVLLAGMEDGDVLFIDEIHTLAAGGKKNVEWLLNFLQDGVIMGPRGAEVQPKVTVIAATTDAGRLPETLLDRFRQVQLAPYTEDEAAAIAAGMAERMIPKPLPVPTPENCHGIARAASNNPRVMAGVIAHLRNITLVTDGSNWNYDHYDLTEALDWANLTTDGLTRTARRYLDALLTTFNGEAAGAAKVQDVLREPGGLHHTERLLVDKDLIALTKTGRMLTQAGIRRARALEHDNLGQSA